MEIGLFRKLNAIGMLAVSAVLAMAFYSQFTQHELPCPLCLLQRVATVAVLCGLMLNVVKGPKPYLYAFRIFAAFVGGAVSLAQITLHIVPGTGTYGAPFLGLHYYTWAFFVFALIILGTAIIAAYSTQYHMQKFIPFREQSGIAKAAIVISLFFVTLNAISTFVECGPVECPPNPTSYWMFN